VPSPRAPEVRLRLHPTPGLDEYVHLYLMNRGVPITPFHNMALMCPATTAEDVDRHAEVFAAAADELVGGA
jgi:glutamate-1-semialdehyde 2,1-aminomutase